MRHPEDDLQKAVAQLLDLLGWLWWHTPNGGKRSAREAARLKAMGVKAGVPDVLIFERTNTGFGCAIELKIKPNKPTVEQLATMEALRGRGWQATVCHSMDEVMMTINAVRPANGRRI